jgi:UDP-N-acetylmuramate--alanine ligase
VSSQLIFDKVSIKNKILCTKNELIGILKDKKPKVLVTLGAGDIETLLPDIEDLYREK